MQAGLEDYNPSRAVTAARDFFWNDTCDWYLELIKTRLREDGASAGTARQVLATVLDQVLRLFHPFVPFITEELWRALAELAPERGIATALPTSVGLTTAAWPEADNDARDSHLEEQIASMQQLVSAVRETRARYGVPPKKELEIRVRATDSIAEAIAATTQLASRIGFFGSLTVAPDAARTADAATITFGEGEAYVLGVVDPAEEKKKLTAQLEKLNQQIAKLEKKLANEGFVAKAPPEVVEKERQNLVALTARRDSIQASLDALD